jgi:hypothetical protein
MVGDIMQGRGGEGLMQDCCRDKFSDVTRFGLENQEVRRGEGYLCPARKAV